MYNMQMPKIELPKIRTNDVNVVFVIGNHENIEIQINISQLEAILMTNIIQFDSSEYAVSISKYDINNDRFMLILEEM